MASEFTSEVVARLQAAGLRATRPRLAVLETLRTMNGHHTADEVHAHLVKHDIALPRTSVYNSLVVLADLGLVLRADVGPGAAVYEVAEVWHHHFVCRQCGVVSDVACVIGEKPCLTPSDDVGQIDEAQVIFRGICRHCLDKNHPAGRGEPATGTARPGMR